MISEANQKAIEAAGLSFILGARSPHVPMPSPGDATSIPARRSPTGRCSPSRGQLVRPVGAVTRSSTTSTATTEPGGPCAASTCHNSGLEISKITAQCRVWLLRLGVRAGQADPAVPVWQP
jgi:hypothetical protein